MRKLCAIATLSQSPQVLLAALLACSICSHALIAGAQDASDSQPAAEETTQPSAEETQNGGDEKSAAKSEESSDAGEPAEPADAEEKKSTAKSDDSAESTKAGDVGEEKRFAAVSVEVPKPIDMESEKVVYPRLTATDGGDLYLVDIDLPGIWKLSGDKKSVYAPGTKLLRKPMNRPWCVTPHPSGGILVGDSATREIYAIAESGNKLTALNGGYLGIPMAIAVSPDKKMIYVGDAEKRAVFRLPITGGKPELVARVNARGLEFDGDGNLWAVTPDAAAVQKIDVNANKASVVIDGRPYQFPGGITWVGDHGYVTDSYGNSIWKFTADGKTEKWLEGAPMKFPVGISSDEKSLYVTDPKSMQVFQIDRETKKVTNRL